MVRASEVTLELTLEISTRVCARGPREMNVLCVVFQSPAERVVSGAVRPCRCGGGGGCGGGSCSRFTLTSRAAPRCDARLPSLSDSLAGAEVLSEVLSAPWDWDNPKLKHNRALLEPHWDSVE